jgi:dTMP kinase
MNPVVLGRILCTIPTYERFEWNYTECRKSCLPQRTRAAMFFSFDGVDGVGKTTQMQLFCQWLRESGRDVVACRDPGSTQLGEALRQIVLGSHTTPIHRRSEMLLYMAARAQLVEEVIRPALEVGKTVVSDRFLLANVVYQGHAGGLDVESVWQVGRIATAGVQPALTFLLDMNPNDAAGRIERELDRMEAQGLEYLQKVRDGFLAEAARRTTDIVIINAARDIDSVQADIRGAAEKFL